MDNNDMTSASQTQPVQSQSKSHLVIVFLIGALFILTMLLGYMYFNLNTKYNDLETMYNQLVTANSNANNTQPAKTVDTDTEDKMDDEDKNVDTNLQAFSFLLSNPGSDAPDVKFTGKMPANLSVVPHEENTIKSAEILGTNFQMSFFEHYEDFWGTFDSFTEIDTANLGKLAFVENVGSTANYQYQKKYVSMNEFFKTEGQCESMGELVNAPCGPNMIYVTENNATKYLFVVSCNTNSQADFQTCHDIVKSIKFEEVN